MRSPRHGLRFKDLARILAVGTIATSSMALAASCGSSAAAHPTTQLIEPGLVRPGSVHIGAESAAEAAPVVHVAQNLYTFWNTGQTRYLLEAVSPDFKDGTLPAGRPQGRIGIEKASATFRAAVPDLRCELADLYVTGDTFTARLVFTGSFTGTLDGHRGKGQPIRFNAIDIQHVGVGGRITEDWHIEDNLTFMQQAGVIPG